MDSNCRFQVPHLAVGELDYELRIRGVVTSRNMNEKRKILARLLNREKTSPGRNIDMSGYDVPPEEEMREIGVTLDSIKALVEEFEGNEGDTLFKRIMSRLGHLSGRISRMPIPDNDVSRADHVTFKDESLASCLHLEAELFDKLTPAGSGDGSALAEASFIQPVVNVPAPVVNVSRATNLSEWGVKFNGDPKSIFTFLERVDELAQARKVTNDDLFRSAVELFVGDAFVWYRSVKGTVSDWDSLVSRLKADFLPANFDDELWDQIKGRKLKKSESVVIFIAHLENLFKRLSREPAEVTKVKVIRQNLSSEFIAQLALVEISTVSELRNLCRKLEESLHSRAKVSPTVQVCACSTATRPVPQPTVDRVPSSTPKYRADRTQSLPSRNSVNTGTSSGTPGPSLPIPSTSRAPVNCQDQKGLTCWNCGRPNHSYRTCTSSRKKFCFRCGQPEVTVKTCPRCSKN